MTAALTAQALDRIVEAQVGYQESGGRDGKSGNITKFGAAMGLNGFAWCSIFVWWCFMQLGIDLRKVISGNYAGAEQAMEGFAKHGWKIVKGPRFMDVVFFHFDGEHSGANHTGFVVAADAKGVHTIEGNTQMPGATGSQRDGGGVYRRYRPYSTIIGYGRYPFAAVAPAVPKVKPVSGEKAYPTLHNGVGTTAHPDARVKRLQTLLHVVPADGAFGPRTDKAVRAFQARKHLLVDGVAGPASLRAMAY